MATKKPAQEAKADTRFRKELAPDSRADRADSDAERTAETEDELRQRIRSEFVQEALPSIPDRNGWHFCWLTNSSQDPIHKRLRLGYQLATAQDVEGYGLDEYKATQGDYAGGITCNEMVLAKISMERWQIVMQEFHHHMPLEGEVGIRQSIEAQSAADRKGKRLVNYDDEDDGLQQLGRAVKVPTFT